MGILRYLPVSLRLTIFDTITMGCATSVDETEEESFRRHYTALRKSQGRANEVWYDEAHHVTRQRMTAQTKRNVRLSVMSRCVARLLIRSVRRRSTQSFARRSVASVVSEASAPR